MGFQGLREPVWPCLSDSLYLLSLAFFPPPTALLWVLKPEYTILLPTSGSLPAYSSHNSSDLAQTLLLNGSFTCPFCLATRTLSLTPRPHSQQSSVMAVVIKQIDCLLNVWSDMTSASVRACPRRYCPSAPPAALTSSVLSWWMEEVGCSVPSPGLSGCILSPKFAFTTVPRGIPELFLKYVL